MRSESITSLERETRRVVSDLTRDKTAVILGDNGSPAAYLVDPETYEKLMDKLRVLEALARAEADIAAGRTLTHAQVRQRMEKWRA